MTEEDIDAIRRFASHPDVQWFANRSDEAVRYASPIAQVMAEFCKKMVAEAKR